MVGAIAMFRSVGITRLLWAALAGASTWLIWTMQSRGAMVGFVAALGAIFFLLSPRSRALGFGLIMIGIAVVVLDFAPDVIERAEDQFRRGQSNEKLASMTGRTRAWRKALVVIERSPALGHGHNMDRFLIDEHVHNTYFYAAITAGLIGLVLYVLGIVGTWIRALSLLGRRHDMTNSQWVAFTAAFGILTFFTARSIPEVSGCRIRKWIRSSCCPRCC